jgi:carboxymethylenebutenolidase
MATPLLRTEELSFHRDGDLVRAYGAWLRRERQPALIVIHDVRGLTEHYRDIARRFASEGYFALAVDLYSREGAPQLTDVDSALAWMKQLDDRRILADIDSAFRYLSTRHEVRSTSIGITGFCMGGQYALMAACTVPEIAACVSFYGMLRYDEPSENRPQSPLDLAPQLGCPYLGLFGAEDLLIPRADVRQLEGILRREGKTFQTKVYRKAGHAFFNDQRPDSYRPDAARDAWARSVAFLRAHLEV